MRFATQVALLAALVATTALARAAEPAKVDVRGDDVAFYPYAGATTVAANGHVVARAGSRIIRADALQYNVNTARITAAGDVRVTQGTRLTMGEAYEVDLATGEATVLRLTPGPSTFSLGAEPTAPEIERPAAVGTFAEAALDRERPYIRSHHAIVVPGASVRMTPAEFPTGAGPAVALPTFLYTLVQNQNLAQNAGPGASFDQPYNLFGSTNSLTAAHVRYDAQNGVTLGVDNRLVERDRAYAVTSLLPFRGRRADLLAYQQLRPGVQQTLSASHTFGASHVDAAAYRLQATGRASIETLTGSVFAATNSVELALSTIPHDVGRYFSYQLRTGYGYDHALYGYPFANAFRTFAGGYVTLPGATLLGTSVNARYDVALTAYDFPHEVTSGTLTLSAGRAFSRGVNVYASSAFAQTANRYRDGAVGRRALGLPVAPDALRTPDGTPYLGYFAFAGSNTFRTYQVQTSFAGRRGDDRVQFTLVHTRDFPQFDGYGRPPFTVSVDVTRRLTPTIRIELGRSYTFGWAGRYLSPQYTFGISP